MDSRDEVTLPATRPKSRKSLSHISSANSMDKENMTADIGGLMGGKEKRAPLGERAAKKMRSKSIGPGGLDALKDSAGNRRKSISAAPPKSILKPTIPALREIPAHISMRVASPKKPSPPKSAAIITGADSLPNPFSLVDNAATAETRVLLRTEEEQQAAAREREEKETQDAEKTLTARRDARRKSLANRRVSFAPEATLHTWDVVEYMQDSTTSSASTDPTRRASSSSGDIADSPQVSQASAQSHEMAEPPSTPPEQIEEDTTDASPAHQRNLHQKKRRRSSGIPPLNFNNPDDEEFSSSPSDGSSVAGADDRNEDFDNDLVSDSNSDTDDDGTAMSLDMADGTDMSMMSVKSSASSTGSSARLENALQMAAQQAGTQGIDFDEHGELDAEEDEVIASFTPWSKKAGVANLDPMQDQENLNPFSPAFRAGVAQQMDEVDGMTMDITRAVGGILVSDLSDEEMTMDMTTAVGGILPEPGSSARTRRKSVQPSRRQSTRRRSSGDYSSFGDETMDLTMAIGGIQSARDIAPDAVDDEDMTMELTTVIGGVLQPGIARGAHQSNLGDQYMHQRRESNGSAMSGDDMDMDMDMTFAVGRILPPVHAKSPVLSSPMNGNSDQNAPEIVLEQQPSPTRKSRRVMEQKLEHARDGSSPFQTQTENRPLQAAMAVTVASETGSPSLSAFKGKGLRRSGGSRGSTTPQLNQHPIVSGSPTRKPGTPSKQLTPKLSRPTTPAKTPPSKNVVMRSASPKRLFTNEIKTSTTPKVTPSKKRVSPSKLFQQEGSTGTATPVIVLAHSKRRSSGIGIDRTGLGSPRIAAILDRRGSIGTNATPFTSGNFVEMSRGVRFGEAEIFEHELDQARREDWDREDGRKIMEHEADIPNDEDKDATINLKEMIDSLTPKKRSLKGRKSLHVGAAKGILGKRPVELDDDDDDDEEMEDQDGVKRLKNHQGSPVKNVKLQAPPTKEETTGRSSRAARQSLEIASGNIVTPTILSSPEKQNTIRTPKVQGRFKDTETQSGAQIVVPFNEKEPVENLIDDTTYTNDRMQLQDFLNLTSIRFMELTTTKRRHTIVPGTLLQDAKDTSLQDDTSFESCVVAGASTVPMLELFQHSCRELKKYISEGRSIVREIETETYEENPPLFQEYISAAPDFRAIMDNQFKNVKTHARLLSKAMWYEWRMKLLEGIKGELFKISEGMAADSDILHYQQQLLGSILPLLLQQHDQVALEEADLQIVAEQLASCDQNALHAARQRLTMVDENIKAKQLMIQDLKNQIQNKDAAIVSTSQRKQLCLDDIREAERIREECRGWTGNEIVSLKGKVDNLEQKYGWTVTGISGTITSLSYRGDLELVFDISSFKPNGSGKVIPRAQNSRLDLWYIAGNREHNPLPLTTEKNFFLESIRDRVRAMPQSQTTIKELLHAVSTGWHKAISIVDDIQSLTLNSRIEIRRTSDSSIVVSAMLLLAPLASKVELQFHINAESNPTGLEVRVQPKASVVYGERFNEKKMTEFLSSRIGDDGNGQDRTRVWTDTVLDLEVKLLARGQK